jgi:hypothetical protein
MLSVVLSALRRSRSTFFLKGRKGHIERNLGRPGAANGPGYSAAMNPPPAATCEGRDVVYDHVHMMTVESNDGRRAACTPLLPSQGVVVGPDRQPR